MIVVAREVLLINVEVVISIEFPELAVDNVKVLVAEVRHDLIDVFFLLQQLYHFH